jgi:hypothetical protein
VVEFVDDRSSQTQQGNEVENVVIPVEVVLDLNRDPIVVPVDSLALVTVVSDEVPRAEHQIILGHTDLVTRARHVGNNLGAG